MVIYLKANCIHSPKRFMQRCSETIKNKNKIIFDLGFFIYLKHYSGFYFIIARFLPTFYYKTHLYLNKWKRLSIYTLIFILMKLSRRQLFGQFIGDIIARSESNICCCKVILMIVLVNLCSLKKRLGTFYRTNYSYQYINLQYLCKGRSGFFAFAQVLSKNFSLLQFEMLLNCFGKNNINMHCAGLISSIQKRL